MTPFRPSSNQWTALFQNGASDCERDLQKKEDCESQKRNEQRDKYFYIYLSQLLEQLLEVLINRREKNASCFAKMTLVIFANVNYRT